ncbi:MAG: ATP-binding cassette domain-containing protein [Chloroflexi bacterium]|nr:ATP-binding cassette domain-containing protein [Chloroflexota bacterium]MBU1748499.1 ATP-binding cassette domain-containing protein [Chloroflexota bacterium]
MIDIHDLHHTYERPGADPVEALRGVSLALDDGEFVAIVGANGSGKTTLARHLNALLLPTRGRVRVAGLDTANPATWPAIRAQVAMVFQRPEDQIVATTVDDDVAFGPENLGLPTDEIEGRVRWALETVGMWDLRHQPPHLLSAGQQQRVAIAGALAMHPRCLVLDEATAMLDPAGRRKVLALLGRLHAEGLTIVLITHWMREAALADRVVALGEGRVAYDGPPRPFFGDADRLAGLGLEPPPLTALAAGLARCWPGFPADLLTLDELAEAIAPRLPRVAAPAKTRPNPPPSTDQPIVAVRDLRHIYLAGTPLAAVALDGVGLEVRAGEVVALLGPTGSGKSTLLQHVAGLLRPSAGQVLVAGRDVNDPATDRRFLREQVGMLFQRSEEQLFEAYVGDDVAFGPWQLGLDREAVRERVSWAMKMAGLPFLAYKDRFTQSLSGGEQRKAALAGVLALRPRVLLLDEPTAGLDPQARRVLLATLRHLNQQEGVTLVIATHAMEDVAALAHRAYVLNRGQIVAAGPPRQLFQEPDRLTALGLEVPEVTALMHRLRAADALTVEEAIGILCGESGTT